MTDQRRRVDPRPGESEDDFVSRCMSSEKLQSEFPDDDQRLAVCFSEFRSRDKQDVASEDLDDGGRLNPDQGGGRRCPAGKRWDPAQGRCVQEESFSTRAIDVSTRADHHGCSEGERFDGTLGRCVKKIHLDAWSPEEELRSLKDEHQRVLRANYRYRQEGSGITSLGNRQSPGRDEADPFLAVELTLAVALAERAFQVADDDILPLYEDALPDDPAMFNQATLEEANDEAGTIWSRVAWTAALAAAATAAITRAFRQGEAQVVPNIAAGAPSTQKVLDNMVRVSQFRTNEYFNTQVMPSLQRQVNDLFSTGAFEQADLGPVRRTLDRRLKSVPYWRVVANAAASRSYHYGLLKAAQFQGFSGYTFTAVLDERTSDICRDTNGRQWFIADAVNKFEMVAGSDDPDEVKRIFPWVSVDDVSGQSNDALRDMGVMVPPLHGNCRSTLVPIF